MNVTKQHVFIVGLGAILLTLAMALCVVAPQKAEAAPIGEELGLPFAATLTDAMVPEGTVQIAPVGTSITENDGTYRMAYPGANGDYYFQYDAQLNMAPVWDEYSAMISQADGLGAVLNPANPVKFDRNRIVISGNWTLKTTFDEKVKVDAALLDTAHMQSVFNTQIGTFGTYFKVNSANYDAGTRTFTVQFSCTRLTGNRIDEPTERPNIIHVITPPDALKVDATKAQFTNGGTVDLTNSSLTGNFTIDYLALPGNPSVEDGLSEMFPHVATVDCGTAFTNNLQAFDLRLSANETELTVARLFGDNRYATASVVARYQRDRSDVVFLASGEDRNWPDALTASGGAGLENAPIVLTPFADTVGPDAMAVIQKLQAKRVVICGGVGAVSPGVENQLKNKGYAVTRLGGDNRMETAERIFDAYAGRWSGNHIIVCTSMVFADSLSVSPYAYSSHCPILLTDFSTKDLTPATRSIISGNGYSGTKAMICGGTAAVGGKVDGIIKAAKPALGTPQRIFGDNRYETSGSIATFEIANAGFDADNIAFARGLHHADALVGGALQGMSKAPLVLVDPGQTRAGQSILRAHDGTISEVRFFGGTSAVSEATSKTLIETVHYLSINWVPDNSVVLPSVLATNPA